MMYNNLTNDELLRELEAKNSDCPLLKELSTRLFEFEEGDETINDNTDKDYTSQCVDHMEAVAGEDYHQDIMNEIRKLETMKKMVDRKQHIDYIIERLNSMDREALDFIEAVKDGMFL